MGIFNIEDFDSINPLKVSGHIEDSEAVLSIADHRKQQSVQILLHNSVVVPSLYSHYLTIF
jgi:hypothetical protein